MLCNLLCHAHRCNHLPHLSACFLAPIKHRFWPGTPDVRVCEVLITDRLSSKIQGILMLKFP